MPPGKAAWKWPIWRHILGGKIMEQKEKELQPQTRAYTVEEIAAILRIGRSSAYTLDRKSVV